MDIKRLLALFLVLALASPVGAQNEPAGSSRVFRQGGGQLRFSPTYIVAASGQATTAAILVSIEPDALKAIRLASVCISTSAATAAAAVTVTVQRRTTAASSGGTALTNEGTGSTTVTKMDPNDANYTGIARLGGTPGTAGAVLDQFSFVVDPIAAPGGPIFICKKYGDMGEKAPVIPAGVINGVSINISAAGAGGLAGGSVTATIVQE